MASDNKHNEYFVADLGNHRIKKINADFIDSDCKFIFEIGSFGSEDDQFSSPSGICVDEKFVYTTEVGNHRIKKLKRSDFSFIAKIGTVGSGNNNFNTPRNIATDGENLYISDETNQRIKVHKNSDLSFHFAANSLGVMQGIATDGDNIFATSTSSFHIVRMSISSLTVLESSNSFSGNLAGICIDETHVWAMEQVSGNIFQFLKSDLSSITAQGSYGFAGFSISRGFNEIVTKNSSLNTDGFLRKLSLTNLTATGIKVSNGIEGTDPCQFSPTTNFGFGTTSYEFERFVNTPRALNSKKVNHRSLEGALFSYNL